VNQNGAVSHSYDVIADEYARRISGELEHKPVDRQLLDRFADGVAGHGRVCDVGCGPGHVTRYLHERGVDVVGIDLSRRMIAVAAELNPGIEFAIADVLALHAADASWAGAVAFYSLIHLTHEEIPVALRELNRVLRADAPLLIAFHEGEETRHLDDWWERPVSLDTYFFRVDWFGQQLVQAGFLLEDVVVRPPYLGVEVETRRAYIQAIRASEAVPSAA
jgi:SAM-dependent methyltransferase